MSAPRPPLDEDDPEWWADATRERRSKPLVALGVLLLVAAGFGGYLMVRGPAVDPANVVDASAPSPVEDPATLLPITMHAAMPTADDIFTARVLRFTIALDQAAKRGAPADGGSPEAVELARAEEGLRSDDVREALGPRAATAMGELVTAAKAAAAAPSDDEPTVAAFEIATARLDNALVAAGLPYFVDASVIVDGARNKRLLLLYEFSIIATGVHASGAAKVRAVLLRRLDRLNWSHTLLGFVNPYRTYAVVLLDQIDEQLVTNVVPALAPEAAMPLLASEAPDGEGAGGPPAPEAIARRAGENVRAEVDEVLGANKAAGRELGEAVRARRALFDKWNQRLKGRGTLKSPVKLDVDVDALERELGPSIPPAEIAELRAQQKRLERLDVRKAYATLRDAFVASVERHEVQHRLDQITPIPTPKALDALVPPGAKAAENVRNHVRSELSAYLAQIARDEPLTRTTFTMLLRFLADPRVRGGAESYAALVATEQLAAELGIAGVAPLFHDGKLDDARIDLAHRELTNVPAPKLRDAARKVWSRLFGAPLAPLAPVP
ncbi:MAG TPA: hypothetical protein VLT33_14575 [Labilithrix sp.]|nr:hypothetical protein [Labilithrix sp.]